MIATETYSDLPLTAKFGEPLTTPVSDAMRRFLWPDGQQCYALLDGAAVRNLPELLDTSGLEHDCLFQGDAAKDLANVAPWLVSLRDGSAFTRSLFTGGDAPWQLWGTGPLLLLQSGRPLSEIRAHLRKFTRLEGTDGRHYFFRFWEAAYLDAFLLQMIPGEAAKLFNPDIISSMVSARSTELRRYVWDTPPPRSTPRRLLMTPDLRTLFGYVAQREFDQALRVEHCEHGVMDQTLFDACLETARRNGFYARAVLRDYVSWCAEENANIMQQDWAVADLLETRKYRETLRFDRLRLAGDERV